MPNDHPFVVSDPTQPDEARSNLERFGYVYFPRLLPEEPLLDLRRDVVTLCQQAGWLLPGSDPMEGRSRPDAYEGLFEFTDPFVEFQRLERFHSLAHRPELKSPLSDLLEGEVFAHPRNIIRVTLPQSLSRTTPVHQDYPLIQGSQGFVTVWFPLSDCPSFMGNLAIASGGHRFGALPLVPIDSTGGVTIDLTGLDIEWHNSDMKLGDVLIFKSLTPHKALPNQDPQRLRISCDFRFQRVDEPVTWDSLLPHMQRMTWEDVYRGWKSKAWQYYWRKIALHVVPFEPPFEEEPVSQARQLKQEETTQA